jgi:hypothetical protein
LKIIYCCSLCVRGAKEGSLFLPVGNISKKSISKEENEEKFDFIPKTGRGPKNNKIKVKSDFLIAKHGKQKIKEQRKISEKVVLRSCKEKVKMMRRQKYKQLFDLLDIDEDGLVCSKNLDISSMLFQITLLFIIRSLSNCYGANSSCHLCNSTK